jgi:hypothetical protein
MIFLMMSGGRNSGVGWVANSNPTNKKPPVMEFLLGDHYG